MTPDDEALALALYQVLRAKGRVACDEDLGKAAGLDTARARRGRQRLDLLGLIEFKEGAFEAVEPDAALARTLDAHHAASVEHARRSAELYETSHALMTVYRSAVTRDASEVEVEYITEPRRKSRAVADLNAMTQRTSDNMHPRPLPPAAVLDASLREDEALIGRGVRVRAIYPQSLLHTPAHARYLQDLAGLGAEVRLIDHAPCDLLVFDRMYAFLCADPNNRSGPMLVIRGMALATSYVAFYEDFWLRAVPYEQARGVPGSGEAAGELTAQERVVIRLMAGGLTDDQIARRMGVHRRTVQRAVTKLMERLNASSRFEAGLKLARDPGFSRTRP